MRGLGAAAISIWFATGHRDQGQPCGTGQGDNQNLSIEVDYQQETSGKFVFGFVEGGLCPDSKAYGVPGPRPVRA